MQERHIILVVAGRGTHSTQRHCISGTLSSDRMFAVTDNCICNISSNLPAVRYTPLPPDAGGCDDFRIVTDESSSDDVVDE